MKHQKTITILGAGPTGLMLAFQLQKRQNLNAKIVLVEKESHVGGIAGGFEFHGLHFDYGSHRLHPQTNPMILGEIESLLKDDLLDRPRNGRIRILDRYIRFPLNPIDLILRLPPSFVMGFLSDIISKPFRRIHSDQHSFAAVLLKGLGKTMSEKFYFPYAQKLWGETPEKLSEVQAQKRVAASSFGKIILKVFSKFIPRKKNMASRFYYPRYGFYEICEKMSEQCQKLGVELIVNAPVTELKQNENGYDVVAGQKSIQADMVFSTIPITELAPMLPNCPQNAVEHLKHRAMVFFYLILKKSQFLPYDAHYFPEFSVRFARMAEMSNYTDLPKQDVMGLCFEIPCEKEDATWNATDDNLRDMVLENLAKIDLTVQKEDVLDIRSEKKDYIYPVYDLTFQSHFHKLDDFIHVQPNLITLGRQGLFVHDNTHHAMEMSVGAAECLRDDFSWDDALWRFYREKFNQNVVVD